MALNSKPVVLYSSDGGGNWVEMQSPSQSSTMEFSDVEFLAMGSGILIGNDLGVGRAYRARFNGTTVAWAAMPLPGVGGAVWAVELEGNDVLSADGYIVGNGGLVLRLKGGLFTRVTGIEYHDQPLTVDLLSVAMAPDGPDVLIGARYDAEDANAEQEGLFLRHTQIGATMVWECVRTNAGYDIPSIHLFAGGRGYLVGNCPTFQSASFDRGKNQRFGVVGLREELIEALTACAARCRP